MSLAIHHQIQTTLRDADHILVCFPEDVSGDGLATSLGVARAIEQLKPGHQVDVVSSGFHDKHTKRYAFLNEIKRVRTQPRQDAKLTIRVPETETNYDLQHTAKDGTVEITLTTPSTKLDLTHVETALQRHAYDVIVVVDCVDLTMLGSLYHEHAHLFAQTPIIAIDHAADHERYAHIHAIDLTASSCGEVAAILLQDIATTTIDDEVATCLLAGILAKTRSFRTAQLSPKTFAVTSTLLSAGARRDDILQSLLRTKTVAQLQLWGRALMRLRHDADRNIVWTILSNHDVVSAGAHLEDLGELVDDLLVNAPAANIIILMAEQGDGHIHVAVHAPTGRHDAQQLIRPLGSTGSAAYATATLEPSALPTAERRVLDTVALRMKQGR
jgi:bifunctional oligoribonuclease and PAP phosphatase NrnA